MNLKRQWKLLAWNQQRKEYSGCETWFLALREEHKLRVIERSGGDIIWI
jgi:hypothetical protein